MTLASTGLIEWLGTIDPAPFFGASLFPYPLFLYWAQKSKKIPQIALIGFKCTLLFVFMTIVCALIAMFFYSSELTDIDPLHGIAESFLTFSDALIVLGFLTGKDQKVVNNS